MKSVLLDTIITDRLTNSVGDRRFGIARSSSTSSAAGFSKEKPKPLAKGQEPKGSHMLPLEYLEGTYNPTARPGIFDDPTKWTPLQRDLVLAIANAKFDVFHGVVEYVAKLVRLELVTKQDSVDLLHEIALYNALYIEYGHDRIQKIIATAFKLEAA